MDAEIGTTASHRVISSATAFPVEIDVDLGHRPSAAVLALVVEPFTLTLPECLLLRIVQVGVAVQTGSGSGLGVADSSTHLVKCLFAVEDW